MEILYYLALSSLQAYKSTGDYVKGSEFFNSSGAVTDEHLKWRKILIERRQPRRLLVQCNTQLREDGKFITIWGCRLVAVLIKEYFFTILIVVVLRSLWKNLLV